MSDRLALTYGGFSYLDRTMPLQTGEIVPEGIDLNYATIAEIGALFRRMAQFQEFDVAEMSLSTLILMKSREVDELVAIPVFPSRSFRHSFLFVGEHSGIESPRDLAGKQIGVQDYQATAYLWIRDLLNSAYGVSPSELTWFIGGLDIPTPQHRLRHEPPPGVDIRPVPGGASLEAMLETGEIDAVFTPEELVSTTGRPASWRRLLPDHDALEREFFSSTGFFPIMHTVAMRRDVYQANPWIACSLLDAFERAKQLGYSRLRDLAAPGVGLPFLPESIAELDTVFGGDPSPYGFRANEAIVQEMTRLSFEQALATRLVSPEELFAPETIDYVPLSL